MNQQETIENHEAGYIVLAVLARVKKDRQTRPENGERFWCGEFGGSYDLTEQDKWRINREVQRVNHGQLIDLTDPDELVRIAALMIPDIVAPREA